MSISLEVFGSARWELSPAIEQASAPPVLAPLDNAPLRPARSDADPRHSRWGARTVIACPEGVRAPTGHTLKMRIAAVAGLLIVLSVAGGFGMRAGHPGALPDTGAVPPAEVTYAPPPLAYLDMKQSVATQPAPVSAPRTARHRPMRAPAFTIARSTSRAEVSPEQVAAQHFRRGNALATKGRWAAARAAYAAAVAQDPRPDYAFNLAVSSEHLGQNASALAYYRKALAGAGDEAAGFAPALAQARIAALSQGGARP